MCRAINIPARLVTGFEIKQQSNARPRVWVEVFLSQRWEPYDPEYGYTQTLPMNYVPARRGGDKIWRAELANNVADVYKLYRRARRDRSRPVAVELERRGARYLKIYRFR